MTKGEEIIFSNELLTLIRLVDKNLIEMKSLYGSWAGALGNFQFMPSTIMSYSIDYDKDGKIELKNSLIDSLASAANYINKMGWRRNSPCFYRVVAHKDIKKKYINLSAKKLSYKFSIKKWKKMGIKNIDGGELTGDYKAALILPDKQT